MRRLGLVFCCAVLLAMSTTGCASQQADTYRVGYIVSQSGPYAPLGMASLEGAQLKVKQLNEAGGINGKQIELVAVDDKGTTTDSATGAQKLIDDGVLTVASAAVTALSISLIPILNDNETPGLIIAGTGLVNDQLGAWTFKPSSSEYDYMPLPLSYLIDEMGATTVAAMIENSGYGEGGEFYLDQVSSSMGIEVVEKQHYDPGATDMTPQLANIKSSGAESILIWGSGPAGALAIKQAREMGIMVPIVTTPAQSSLTYYNSFKDAYEMEPSVACLDNKPTIWPQLPDSDPDKAMCRDFQEKFDAEYGRIPGIYEAIGYSFMTFIADSLDRSNPDLSDLSKARSQLRDAYEQTKDLSVIIGTYTMSPTDHYGRTVPKEVLVTFKDGEKVLAKTYADMKS
ncbi:MAG: ABC transporter substrate-binding protein [Dehalococcoidia bacterium]|nr:ABC transporter substrate-binding protein [Dehalococcoidia bacterium]